MESQGNGQDLWSPPHVRRFTTVLRLGDAAQSPTGDVARRGPVGRTGLGLHPAAIALVGGMIKALAEDRQVIVATQSPLLVDAFGLDEIFVLDLRDGRTEFRKLAPENYRVWLNDSFTPGELWQKNLLGGRP